MESDINKLSPDVRERVVSVAKQLNDDSQKTDEKKSVQVEDENQRYILAFELVEDANGKLYVFDYFFPI